VGNKTYINSILTSFYSRDGISLRNEVNIFMAKPCRLSLLTSGE